MSLQGLEGGEAAPGRPVSVGRGHVPVWPRACVNVGDCEAVVR